MPPQFENQTPITSPEIQNSPTSKPKHRHSLFYFVLALALIIVVLGGLFFYVRQVSNNVYTEPLAVETPADEFSDWKTYRNEEYGFEIKLPPDWTTRIDDYFESPVFISPETGESVKENCKSEGGCIPSLPDFDILFTSLDSEYKDYIEPSVVVEIENNKWTRYLGDGLLATTHYVLSQEDKFFNFGAVGNLDENILKQILSTFKFIPSTNSEQVSTSTPTIKGTGQFCGGIAAIGCPTGYECKLDGNYPDAGGKCELSP